MPDRTPLWGLVLAVMGWMALTGGYPSPARAAEPTATRKTELAYFLKQDCGSCHGLTLKGGLGKPLTQGALEPYNDADLLGIILDGRPGTAMPPWRGVIDEADARYIVRLLREGGQ